MQIILLERVENLGQMGDVVRVKDGFARNFLLPRRKALRATKENRARFETQRVQLEGENLKRRSEAEAVAAKMPDVALIVVRQAGDTGQLYGSVSARDIAEGLTQAGYSIGRQQVVIDRPIKTLGIYPIRVQLHPDVWIKITINVARTQEEARLQAQGVPLTAAEREAAAEIALDKSALFEPEALPTEPDQTPAAEPGEA